MKSIRYALLYILSVLAPAALAADGGELQETRDLHALGQQAADLGRPIVLLVSQEHCTYCVRIREEIIDPMLKSGDFAGRVLFRELFMDAWVQARDFSGGRRGAAEVARGYGVDLTPTLLFLSPAGAEIAPRLIGMRTPEMMFAYLDARIQTALEALNRD